MQGAELYSILIKTYYKESSSSKPPVTSSWKTLDDTLQLTNKWIKTKQQKVSK